MVSEMAWDRGQWSHQPQRVEHRGGDLVVTAKQGSDAWRHTSYGFVHDSEHALLAPFRPEQSVEVDFSARFSEQFDQAGIFLRASPERWIKAGVEFVDGVLSLGAVVTDEFSDWSAAPVQDWAGARIRVRASWSGGAVTIRAGVAGDALQMVRVAPFRPSEEVSAGPFLCAPTNAGLEVGFTRWRVAAPDTALHDEP